MKKTSAKGPIIASILESFRIQVAEREVRSSMRKSIGISINYVDVRPGTHIRRRLTGIRPTPYHMSQHL